MVITHKKLQPMQCYHIFSDTRDVYLSKHHYGSYSPQMVPVAEISGSGSWPIWVLATFSRFTPRIMDKSRESVLLVLFGCLTLFHFGSM